MSHASMRPIVLETIVKVMGGRIEVAIKYQMRDNGPNINTAVNVHEQPRLAAMTMGAG